MPSIKDIEKLKARILAEASSDEYGLWLLWKHVRSLSWASRKSEEELRAIALEAINDLVAEGLIQIGNYTSEGYKLWQTSPAQSIKRILSEWQALGRDPCHALDVCWFVAMSRGENLANDKADGNTTSDH